MTDLFLKVLNMSIAASWLILAVLVLRLLLRRGPKWVRPLMWGVVALRLVLPFSFESALSLIPSAETVSTQAVRYSSEQVIQSGVAVIDNAVNPIITQNFTPDAVSSVNPRYALSFIAAVVWLIGIAALLIYALASWMGLRNRVSTAVKLRDNIYQSEFVTSPFVLGVFRPKIYLPYGMGEQDVQHVTAHEAAHIARRDTWFKPLGYAVLCLHWFNPLVWLAWVLFCRDIEYACDERVVRTLSAEQRADYSEALLACSAPGHRVGACPLAFGEGSVKDRVKSVLKYRKSALWLSVVAVVAVAAVAVCFLTNPATGEEPAADSPSDETDEPSSTTFTADGILVEGATGSNIPAFVVQTAREYVAASAGDWDLTGASNEITGPYDVTEAEITSFVLQPTSLGGQTEDGSWALDFYGVNYRLRVEPPENFMPVDNLSVDENGYLNHLVYLLFYNENGEYQYIGANTPQGIAEVYANPDYAAQYPDEFTAAAADMAQRYSETPEASRVDISVDYDALGIGFPENILSILTNYVGDVASALNETGRTAGFAVTAAELTGASVANGGANGTNPDGSTYILDFWTPAFRLDVEGIDNLMAAVDGLTAEGSSAVYGTGDNLLIMRSGDGAVHVATVTTEQIESYGTDEMTEQYGSTLAAAATEIFNFEVMRQTYSNLWCSSDIIPGTTASYAYEGYIGSHVCQPDAYSIVDGAFGVPSYYLASAAFVSFDAERTLVWDGDAISTVNITQNHMDIERLGPVDCAGYSGYLARVTYDLYTPGELEQLAQQGVSVPENETTSEYWAVYMARPGEPVGWMVCLAANMYTQEDVLELANNFSY